MTDSEDEAQAGPGSIIQIRTVCSALGLNPVSCMTCQNESQLNPSVSVPKLRSRLRHHLAFSCLLTKKREQPAKWEQCLTHFEQFSALCKRMGFDFSI